MPGRLRRGRRAYRECRFAVNYAWILRRVCPWECPRCRLLHVKYWHYWHCYRLFSAFQAGHVGSIPFARSILKNRNLKGVRFLFE